MKTFLSATAAAAILLAGSALAQHSSSDSQSSQPGQPQSSQPPQSSSGMPSSGGQQELLVDASSIIGSTVRSSDGRDIGKVDRLMLDPRDGRVRTVLVTMGGALGVGGRSVSMPWDSVKVGQDRGRVVVTAQQGALEQAPSASPGSGQSSNGQEKRSNERK